MTFFGNALDFFTFNWKYRFSSCHSLKFCLIIIILYLIFTVVYNIIYERSYLCLGSAFSAVQILLFP